MIAITDFPVETLSAAAAAGADVALKVTLLLSVVLALGQTLLRRSPFAQAAVYHASWVGLLLLPLAAIALPRLALPVLPAVASETRTPETYARPAPPTSGFPDPSWDAESKRRGGRKVAPPLAHQSDPAHAPFDTLEGPRETPSLAGSTGRFLWPALLVSIYLVGVAVFTLRLAGAWFAARSLTRTSLLGVHEAWLEGLEHWRRRLGVRRRVQIAGSSRTPVPLAVGSLRPMILVPASLAGDASVTLLGAVLVHELCHVRRRDYAWLVMARLLQAVYWFHPLVWILGRCTAQARERVCDELCVHYLGGSEAYRATLIALAASLVQRPKVALGLAAVRSLRIAQRLNRLEKTKGTAQFVLGAGVRVLILGSVLGGAGVVAPLEVTRVASADELAGIEQAEAKTLDAPEDSEQPGTEGQSSSLSRMKLRVVEKETGEAIARASIMVWGLPDERSLQTDEQGELELMIPPALFYSGIVTEARKDGFVAQYAHWGPLEDFREIPKEQVYSLKKGSKISGAVQSKAGESIAGAQVVVIVVGDSKNPGNRVPRSVVRTDDQGRWRCTNVPRQFEKVRFRVSHPDYVLTVIDAAKAGIAVSELHNGNAVLVMNDGIRVSGTVLDAEGLPFEEADVLRLQSVMDLGLSIRKTDQAGRFRFAVEKPGPLTLLIKAKGHAPFLEKVEVAPDLAPLSIQLKPGHVLEGQVIDSSGKPLAGARVGVDEWRDQRGLYWGTQADREGRFRWDGAPPNVVLAYFSYPGKMSVRRHPLIAGKEHVVALSPALTVRGQVLDAETGAPINQFEVIPGVKFPNSDRVHWEQYRRKTFSEGQYDYRFDYPRHAHFIKVEAEGYRPAVSRMFRDGDGEQVFDFRLKKDAGWTGIARLADGRLANGATLFVATPEEGVSVFQGKADPRYGRNQEGTQIGDDGSFTIPSQAGDFLAVFLHEQGYAELSAGDLTVSSDVTLQKWGRVEGTARIGVAPASRVEVQCTMSDANRRSQRNQPAVYYGSKTISDEDGHYRLDWVPSGEAQVYLVLDTSTPSPDSTGMRQIYTQHRSLETRAGETTHLDLGGAGRPVVGRLAYSGSDRAVDWTKRSCTIRLKQPDFPSYPDTLKEASSEVRSRWFEAWQESPAGKAYRAEMRFFTFLPEADGSFRVDDVPAGTYRLDVMVLDLSAGSRRRGTSSTIKHEFTVAEMPGGRSDEPLDLGTIELKYRSQLLPGDVAPAFEVETLDGDRVALEDFRGKFVLLDFWAATYDLSLRETPYLKVAHEAFGEDDRFAMVSLSLDADRKAPRRYAAKNGLAWIQCFVAEGKRKSLLSDYVANGIPQILLVGPDGRLVANNLRGDQIFKTVEAVLSHHTEIN